MYWVFSAPKVLGNQQFKNVQGNNKNTNKYPGILHPG